MGLIATVVSFTRAADGDDKWDEVIVDPGGGANITAPYFRPPGVDAQPLPGDYAVIEPLAGEGEFAVVGFIDAKNVSIAAAGEYRTYTRDSSGVITGSIHSKSDGEHVFNEGTDWAVQFTALKTAFDQFKTDFNSFISVKYNLHSHPTAPAGPVSPPSLTGTSSTADMAGSKVEKVRLP